MIAARSKLPATGQTEKFAEGMKADVARDEKVSDSFDYAVAISCWSMKLLGLWPLDTRLSNLRCGVCLVMMVLAVLPAITCLFMITDMVIMMNRLSMTLPVLQTSIRFVIMKVKAKNLRDVLCNMSCDWTRYRHLPVQDRRSILHYAKRGRRINLVCLGWLVLALAGETNRVLKLWASYSELPRRHENQLLSLLFDIHIVLSLSITLSTIAVFHQVTHRCCLIICTGSFAVQRHEMQDIHFSRLSISQTA